jgi:hypothetical protein
MVDCVEVCVWEPEDGFPEDGEGSLKSLVEEAGSMIEGVVCPDRRVKGEGFFVGGGRMTLQKQAVGGGWDDWEWMCERARDFIRPKGGK